MGTKADLIKLSKDDLQILFDVAVNSLDFSSGFLDNEEVEALRSVAKVLGVNPMIATPTNFHEQYTHGFEATLPGLKSCYYCGKDKKHKMHEVNHDQAHQGKVPTNSD